MSSSNLIALIAIGIALLSAELGWHAARRSLRVTTYSGATDLTLQVDRMLIEYPGLRPFFYDGRSLEEAPEGPERSRVLAAAEYILDILECIWDHRHEYDEVDRESWRRYIVGLIGEPESVLRDLYDEYSREGWYPALDEIYGRSNVPLRERVVARRGRLSLLTSAPPRIPASPPLVAISGSSDNTSWTLRPLSPLSAGTAYTVTLTSAITDSSKNTLAGPISWSFTTAPATPSDTTRPTLAGRRPAANDTRVDPGSMVLVTFSEALDPQSVTDASFALAVGRPRTILRLPRCRLVWTSGQVSRTRGSSAG